MIKYLFLPLVCVLWAVGVSAQDNSVDSLYRDIRNARKADVNTANHLMLLLDAEGCTDSLVRFDRHTPTATMLQTLHLAMAAHYYEQAASMTATLQAGREAERYARLNADTAVITEALAYQAVAASRMGRIDLALEATKEELRLDSLAADTANLSRAYNTLAGLSLQAGHHDDAKAYIRKAIDMERALPDSSHLSVRYGVAAEIYQKAGQTAQALAFAQRAYELDRAAGDEVKTARRLSQMADIYAAKGDHTQAEKLYLRSIDIVRQAGEQKTLAINLKQLGQLYLRQQQTARAQAVLHECEAICRATDNRYTLQQTCRLLAETCRRTNPAQAADYMDEALRLSDSLHTERADALAAELRQTQAHALERQDGNEDDSTPSPLLWTTLLLGISTLGLAYLLYRKNMANPTVPEVIETNPSFPGAVETNPTSPADYTFLARVSELYESNLGRRRLSIDELASEMCMSRSQFTRRILSATGITASNYLNRLRLEKAQRLLKETQKSIGTIADECGFDDTPYFCNIFKKTFGVTPLQYRIMPQTSA